MIRRMIGGAIMSALFMAAAAAQDSDVAWKRSSPPVQPELRLFHSTQAICLPTAETLGKRVFQFEISHRFDVPVSEGYNAFYGLDSRALIRLGLGYSPIDPLVITLARSNLEGNVDLQAKYKLLHLRNSPLPVLAALQGGVSWSTNAYNRFERARGNSRNFQYYSQAIANTMIRKRFALGAVPSYLYNSDIYSSKTQSLFALGMYAQCYITKIFSVLAEWTPKVSGDAAAGHEPAAFGFELETGGHFFKIIATNSVSLNPSQYLAGTEYAFAAEEWRLGFLITRLLHN